MSTAPLFVPLVHSDVHKWQDEQGVTHFFDAPSADTSKSFRKRTFSPADPVAERQLDVLLQSQK